MKILIVEDEALVADSLQFLLETAKHEVAVADDMISARNHLDHDPPDVALVDLRLSNESSGIEIAIELKHMGVPCVLMSAELPPTTSRDLAVGCLHKPFDAESLFAALERAKAPAPRSSAVAEMIGSFEPFPDSRS